MKTTTPLLLLRLLLLLLLLKSQPLHLIFFSETETSNIQGQIAPEIAP
jgi:hypothetical protein